MYLYTCNKIYMKLAKQCTNKLINIKKINYKLNNKIFPFSHNIIIDYSFKKFENNILKLFSLQEKIQIFYQLQLLNFIKIYNILYFYFMRKNLENFLFK